MNSHFHNQKGFSLIELTVIIVIIGILVAVAMKSMTTVTEDVRLVKTEQEMERLARAIVGDPDITAGGARTDFGYVGDIGAFPSDLSALKTNPGLGTWNGPYLPAGFVQDSNGYCIDEWGQAYAYSGGTIITSNGSGTAVTKKIADATSDYLLNTFQAVIRDTDNNPPGPIYLDSIAVGITVPDGAGANTIKIYSPDSAGNFTLDSLPVGQHPLRIIYTPQVDTLLRYITILPRHKSQPMPTYYFTGAYFTPDTTGGTDSMLTKVAGSDSIYSGFCNNISFWIENNTGGDVTIASLLLTWANPTAYYRYVIWDGTTVVNQNNPKIGSGEMAVFSSSQTINDGQSLKIQIVEFRSQPTGGSRVNMQNTILTVLLSDGSTFDVTVGGCP